MDLKEGAQLLEREHHSSQDRTRQIKLHQVALFFFLMALSFPLLCQVYFRWYSVVAGFVLRHAPGTPLLAGAKNVSSNNILTTKSLVLRECLQRALEMASRKFKQKDRLTVRLMSYHDCLVYHINCTYTTKFKDLEMQNQNSQIC